MKQFTRISAALVCAAMLALTACNGDSGTSGNSQTSSQGGSGTTPATRPTDVGNVDKTEYAEYGFSMKEYDVTNKTVKIFVGPERTKADYLSTTEIPGSFELMKAYYGIDVELVSCGDYNDWYTKLAMLSLSDQSPDVATPLSESYPYDIVKNNILPLDEYFDWNDPVWDGTRDILENYSWNGKHYHAVYNDGQYMNPLFYNPKMFKQNGLKTPRDYMEENNWTWTTMRELAVELTQDTDQDGKIDQWGVGGLFFTALQESTGKSLVTVDGKNITNNIDDPVFAKAAQYIYDLGQKGKYKCATAFSHDNADLFASGQVAMDAGSHYRAWTTYKDMWAQGTVDVVPFPRMDENDSYYNGGVPSSVVIFKNAKNIEGAKAFIWTYAYVNSQDYKDKVNAYKDAHNLSKDSYSWLNIDIPNLTEEQKQHIADAIWEGDYKDNPNTWIGWFNNGWDNGLQYAHEKQWSAIVNIYKNQFDANIASYKEILDGLTA